MSLESQQCSVCRLPMSSAGQSHVIWCWRLYTAHVPASVSIKTWLGVRVLCRAHCFLVSSLISTLSSCHVMSCHSLLACLHLTLLCITSSLLPCIPHLSLHSPVLFFHLFILFPCFLSNTTRHSHSPHNWHAYSLCLCAFWRHLIYLYSAILRYYRNAPTPRESQS